MSLPQPTAAPPRLKGRVRPEAFGGLLFCVDPMRILTLNPSGYRIAKMLEAGCDVDTMAAVFADEFRAPRQAMAADIRAFVAMLDEQELLDWQAH